MDEMIVKKEIRSWRDEYALRIDRELRTAFSELERDLINAVKNEELNKLVKGRAEYIKDELLEPQIESWVRRHAEPILEDAQEDLAQVVAHQFAGDIGPEGGIEEQELVHLMKDVGGPVAAILAGVGTMVSGVMVGISTFLWFITIIHWPILLGGLAVGAALTGLGIYQAAKIREKLLKRFSEMFIPKIREAMIGSGYEVEGEHYPSLQQQLKNTINEAANQVIQEVAA